MSKHKWGGFRSNSPKRSKLKTGRHDASALEDVTGQKVQATPVQELEPVIHLLGQLQQEIGPALGFIQKLRQDNQNKDVKIEMQGEEIQGCSDRAANLEVKKAEQQECLRQGNMKLEASQAHAQQLEMRVEQLEAEKRKLDQQVERLTEDLHARDVHVRDLTKKLKQGDVKLEDSQAHPKELKMKVEQLDAEKRSLDKQVEHLTEDLRARDVHVKELTRQLKDADGVAQRAIYLVSRVHALEQDVKHKDLQRKEAEDSYSIQLSISGKLSNETSKLQEETKQLSGSLESTIVKLCTVKSENERLESEAEKQKTKEEGLVCLLQQKEKELLELQEMEKKFSELQQDYDIMCQRLKDVARVATTTVGTAGRSSSLVQHRFCQSDMDTEQESSGVFSMDDSESDLCDSSSSHLSSSHAQSQPVSVPNDHFNAENKSLPHVSTQILVKYLGRMAKKWYELAHGLGVGNEAQALKQTEQDPGRKCLLCLEAWIERGPEVGCSWEKLLNVLCSLQLHAVGKEIQDMLHGQIGVAQTHSL